MLTLSNPYFTFRSKQTIGFIMATVKSSYNKNNKFALKYTNEDIQKIISDLFEWANKDKGIHIASYLYEKYKRPSTWLHELARNHPEMKQAIKHAKELIAGKITNHCFIGDRNSTFGERILPMYSEEYKAFLEWKEKIKQKNLTEQEAQLIVQTVNYAKKANKE